MRARLLKPGFFTNEKLGALPFGARLLFAGLWCLADREGRLEDRPQRIKAELFPYQSVNVNQLLDLLVERGFVIRYEAEEKQLLWLPTFLCHQKPHPREAVSTLSPYLGLTEGKPKARPRTDQGTAKVTGSYSGIGSTSVPIAVPEAVEGSPKASLLVAPDGASACGGLKDGQEYARKLLDENPGFYENDEENPNFVKSNDENPGFVRMPE